MGASLTQPQQETDSYQSDIEETIPSLKSENKALRDENRVLRDENNFLRDENKFLKEQVTALIAEKTVRTPSPIVKAVQSNVDCISDESISQSPVIATLNSSDEVKSSPQREADNLAPVLLKGTKRVIKKGVTTSCPRLADIAPRSSLIKARQSEPFKDVGSTHAFDSGINLQENRGAIPCSRIDTALTPRNSADYQHQVQTPTMLNRMLVYLPGSITLPMAGGAAVAGFIMYKFVRGS